MKVALRSIIFIYVLSLLFVSPAYSKNNFVLHSLPYGISLKIPKTWNILNNTAIGWLKDYAIKYGEDMNNKSIIFACNTYETKDFPAASFLIMVEHTTPKESNKAYNMFKKYGKNNLYVDNLLTTHFEKEIRNNIEDKYIIPIYDGIIYIFSTVAIKNGGVAKYMPVIYEILKSVKVNQYYLVDKKSGELFDPR